MNGKELPLLPADIEEHLDQPYGGLFGDSVNAKVIEEIISDPYSDYRPKFLEQMTGASPPSVRSALKILTSLGLLLKDSSDRQHPKFTVNFKSKKAVALTLLSYAVIDDREHSDCMDSAIMDYCATVLKEKIQPQAVATISRYEYMDLVAIDHRELRLKTGREQGVPNPQMSEQA
jgi:hypothetical protein